MAKTHTTLDLDRDLLADAARALGRHLGRSTSPSARVRSTKMVEPAATTVAK